MPKRLGEKTIFTSRLYTIKDINLEFEDRKVTYQIIEKADTCGIIPVTDDGRLILVNEYVVAHDTYKLDFPGGRIEKGYDILETANKELQEEIGFRAQKLERLATFTMSPGYLTQKSHMFLARSLVASKLKGDEDEELKITTLSFEEVEKLIEEEKINEVRTVAGFYLAKKFLEKEMAGKV